MKLIKELNAWECEVEAETEREKLYAPGDIIEFNYSDKRVIEKKGNRLILK